MFFYLRTAFILCKPDGIYRHDAFDKMLPDGNQCLISPTPEEIKRDQNKGDQGIDDSDDEDPMRPYKYVCPSG